MDFSLLESVPDAIVIIDRRGAIRYVNALAEKLFGYDRAEILGKPVEVLLPARFREMHRIHREGYHAAPRARPMGLGLDLFGLRKDGSEFPAEISLAPLRVEGEGYAISAVRDVTERKKIEERARLYRRARDEVRERDEFLSVASHELRTPVTALQLQLQLLHRAADRSGDSLRQLTLAKLEGLERQTRRIAILVNELLDVSRMRLGRLELRLERLDLAEVARDTLSNLQPEAERAGSTLSVAAAAPVHGDWDRLRIEQVLLNLVTNAIKFGRGRPITVAIDGGASTARVEVTDEGIGIAPEHHERVFQRFERAVSPQHFGGLGLGLYLAREIVEAHGGTIRVRSAPGSGSTFTVELPRSPPAPVRPQPRGTIN